MDPPEIQSALWAHAEPTPLAFDVGAHTGESLHRLRQFADKIVCFEPALESFAQLMVTAEPAITCLNVAVSDVNGTIELCEDPDRLLKGQLVSGEDGPWRTVSALTLDRCMDTYGVPGFVKVDVEGHEFRVLHGAPRLLREHPRWLIEIHSRRLGEKCRELLGNYDVSVVRHPHYRGEHPLREEHFWIQAT